MMRTTKRRLAGIATVLWLSTGSLSGQAFAAVCPSIDAFVKMPDYKNQIKAWKQWVEDLKDIEVLFDVDIPTVDFVVDFGMDFSVSIPCPGVEGHEAAQAQHDHRPSLVPSVWSSVEITQPNYGHPIHTKGIDPLSVRMPPETELRGFNWGGHTLEDGGLTVDDFGVQSRWLDQGSASGDYADKVVFTFPPGLYQDEGFRWLPGDRVVIDLSFTDADRSRRQSQIRSSIDSIDRMRAIERRAERMSNDYRIYRAGLSRAELEQLASQAERGDEDAMDQVEMEFGSLERIANQIDRGEKADAIVSQLRREGVDQLPAYRSHLEGLLTVNTIYDEQDAARRQRDLENSDAGYYDRPWRPDQSDFATFERQHSIDQEVDLLRNGTPLLGIMARDLAFLEEHPHLRSGAGLIEGWAEPEKALRIANILIGRTLDIDPNLSLRPDADGEFQQGALATLGVNNVLRDGLTRRVMAEDFLSEVYETASRYTADKIQEETLGNLEAHRLQVSLSRGAVRNEMLHSQLRQERLMGLYMQATMDDSPLMDPPF